MAKPPKSGLVLLSSGLDSVVALAKSQKDGLEVSLALSFDYGQRSAQRELEHASKLAAHFKVSHRAISLPWFSEFKAQGLLSHEQPLPQPSYEQLNQLEASQDSARQVWVPNRNGVFLEIAAGIAEEAGLDAIIVGFNAEEAMTFADNSKGYLEAMNLALAYSTANQVQVISPTLELQKTDIVALALRLEVPLRMLWSCYEAAKIMCGRCESCMRLKRALTSNGVAFDGYFND